MANNLFVCIQLGDSLDDLSRLRNVMSELQGAHRVTDTTWYVSTELTAAQVATRVWEALSLGDRLLVIDATSNSAAMFNVDDGALRTMRDHWHAADGAWHLAATS